MLLYEYKTLEKLDFNGKGETFVEDKFVTPLLTYLGYDSHKDYEVRRHGDDDMYFKLQYPAVDRGSKTVKHFNPDYMPTIRKKCFWVLEVKSAKNVSYPFDGNTIVQGLQYCIHPEIRAKYLVLTNGLHTSIYDSFSRIYGDGDIYEPILEFSHSEIGSKWSEIYQLLSAEKVREFIEDDILSMYEKVVSSSLDNEYPQRMLRKAEKISDEAVIKINEHVSRLRFEIFMTHFQNQQEESSSLSLEDLDFQMDLPLFGGKSIGQHFVEKCIELRLGDVEIYDRLIRNYETQSYFRKENTIAALCALFNIASNFTIKDNIIKFLQSIKDNELPLINCVECVSVRIRRKMLVISLYPELREEIKRELNVMPEMVKHINPPTVLSETYLSELIAHWAAYEAIVAKTDEELSELFGKLTKFETVIDEQYNVAKASVGSDEREFCGGLEITGLYYKVEFTNIMRNILDTNYKLVDESFDGIGLFF